MKNLLKTFLFSFYLMLTISPQQTFCGGNDYTGTYLPNIDTVIVYSSVFGASKNIYQYDNNDKRILFLELKLNGNDWIPNRRDTYTYDQERLIKILSEYYSNEQWVNSMRQTYTYNENDNVTTYLTEDWNADNTDWVNNRRHTYEYENNKLISDIDEYWANKWIKYRRYRTKYNVNGQKDTTFEASWYDNSEWVDFKRQYYSYNDNGNLIFQMDQALNDNLGWDDAYRHTFTYNDTTAMLEREWVEYLYNGVWLNSSQKIYFYNEYSQLTDIINETSSGGSYYDYREKISSLYDDNHRLYQKFGYKWDEGAQQWIQYDRILNFKYKNESFTAYGYNLVIHYVNPTAINEKGALPNIFTLQQNFPNPFNPSTEIAYTIPQTHNVTLKIYDLRGREITTLINNKQNAGKHTVTFDASQYQLPSGVYIYRISSGAYFDIKKMILVK